MFETVTQLVIGIPCMAFILGYPIDTEAVRIGPDSRPSAEIEREAIA